MTDNLLFVIPTRMNSSRFPNKVFAKVEDQPYSPPMFEYVWTAVNHYINDAVPFRLSRIIVATDSREVEDYCAEFGMECINTGSLEFANGSERTAAIANLVDPGENKYDFVFNVQADQPTLERETISRVVEGIVNSSGVDVMTAASFSSKELDPVYVVGTNIPGGYYTKKALYFSRSRIPSNSNAEYHIGVYGFKRKFLSEYFKNGTDFLELGEHLEQLRVFDMNGTIAYNIVNQPAFSVNTPADMNIARSLLSAK